MAKRSLCTFAILSLLMAVLSAGGQSTKPAPPGDAAKAGEAASPQPVGEKAAPGKEDPKQDGTVAPVGKRERKTLKRDRQREDMIKRQEQRAQGAPPRRSAPPAAPQTTVANPYQYAEDFDGGADWEEKENRGIHSKMDYGYSHTNNLASAGCAPGEIGGSAADDGISWFADNVAGHSVLLDLETPLSASGWCRFTATSGTVCLGWFNSATYAAPDVVPDNFLGWRQEGEAVRAALGYTGTSFVDGPLLAISNGKPFQWSLSYHPIGGANGCGEIVVTVGGSSSTLSLSKEQKGALAAHQFDRFGIVSDQTGTGASTLWLDNLLYTKISGFPKPHPEAAAHTRTAFFDTDPSGSTFLGVNNLSPHEPVTITQDYGYRPTGGRSGGCVGGHFTQAIGTSYYGYDYGDKMLHFTDKLRSEGWFQVPSYEGRALHFGWTSKSASSWHEPSTLGLRISSINIKGQGRRINISPEGGLKNYEGHGGAGWGPLLTISAGPEWHHYIMEFDPLAAYGLGALTVQVDGASQIFYFGEDKLKQGADIDLFGMWNAKIPAEEGAITAYLDNVTNTTNGARDPASNDFNSTPAGWVGCHNSFTAKDYLVRPYHQFGWAKTLSFLDGLNGYSPMYTIPESDRYCMGGIIYLASDENLNVPRASYGADLQGLLNTRDHHLYATGRIKLDWANVDAAELFGWYNSATACDQTTGGKGHSLPNQFLGVAIHGGSSGYGMMPSCRSPKLSEEQMVDTKDPAARVYQDGHWREFYMEYDPDGAGGKGQLKLQLGKDGKLITCDLKEGAKDAALAFDRFGLLTMRKGGGKPHAIYFDKMTYTVAP